MKPFKTLPDKTKVGLTALLLGSLGFNLSMNPEHFNNIVRNDIDIDSGVFELALQTPPSTSQVKSLDNKVEASEKEEKDSKSDTPAVRRMTEDEFNQAVKTAAEKIADEKVSKMKSEILAEVNRDAAKRAAEYSRLIGEKGAFTASTHPPAPAPISGNLPNSPQGRPETAVPGASAPTNPQGAPAPGTPPGQKPVTPLVIPAIFDGQSCIVTVEKKDDKVIGTVQKSTESAACKDDKKTLTLKSSIENTVENAKVIALEVIALLKNDKTDKTEKELAKEKSDALKGKYEALVKSRCRQKGMDYTEKLECMQELLSDFSNELDDSSMAKTTLKNFFVRHVLPSIREGMSSPTITFDIGGRPISDTSKLDAANEAAKSLLENMNSENSDAITQMLAQARAGAYSAQISHAKNIYLEAQEDKKDPTRFQLGLMKENIAKFNLNPSLLSWTLSNDRIEWMNSLSDGDKAHQQASMQQLLFAPVQNFLTQLPKIDTYGKQDANKLDLAAQQLSQLPIPDLSGMGMNTPGLGTPFTPGLGVSGIPDSLIATRLDYQNDPTKRRGGSIPPLTQARGTGQTSIQQQRAGTSFAPQMQQRQQGVPPASRRGSANRQ